MDFKLLKEKMNNSIIFFEKEIASIRTSRANPSILDNILVDSYDNKTPLLQLGTVNVLDSNMITIQVWDSSMTQPIEKAIKGSNLGINPQTDGQIIRLPIPKLSEERREELAKVVSQYGEQAKIAIRNIRRDFIDKIKKDEKDKIITQDESKKNNTEIQKITDEYISTIEKTAANKQSEVLKV